MAARLTQELLDDALRQEWDVLDSTLVRERSGYRTAVGDRAMPDRFVPAVRLSRWPGADEAWFDVRLPLPLVATRESLTRVERVIEHEYDDIKSRFWLIDADPNTPEFEFGGLEWEIVIAAPLSGPLVLDLVHQNCAFYFQPPLDVDPDVLADPNVASVTETEARDADGQLIYHRPIDVVGSYAVYHATRRHGAYRAGKIAHIRRPLIRDADGRTTYGTLAIDPAAGTLTITVPEKWAAAATYPIVIDPTFGYSSLGSSTVPCRNEVHAGRFTLTEDGDVDSLWVAITAGAGFGIIGAIYDSTGGTKQGSDADEVFQFGSSGFMELPYTGGGPSLTGSNEYFLAASVGLNAASIFYDSSGGTGKEGARTYDSTMPSSISGYGGNSRNYSIYAEYTAAGGGGAALAGALSGTGSITGGLTTQIALAAEMGASAGLAADLTTQVPLSASCAASAALGADLTTDIALSTALAAQAAVSAVLDTSIPLSVQTGASATIAAELDTQIGLGAALPASAQLGAVLDTSIPLTATLDAAATLAAELAGTGAELACTLAAGATVGADLTTDITLGTTLAAQALVGAAIDTSIRLSAQPAASASLAASLDSEIRFGAALPASADLAADLAVGSRLAAALQAGATLSPALSTSIRLVSAPAAQAALAAELDTQIGLRGSLDCIASVAPALSSEITLAGTLGAAAQITAALQVGAIVGLGTITAPGIVGVTPRLGFTGVTPRRSITLI